MAVTTNNYGTYTDELVYPAGTTAADLLTAVVNSIVNKGGWSVYDASAGTNAQCLRVLNADGSTYKYLVVDTNTSANLLMKVYESWNSGTHTGTNLANSSGTSNYGQRVDLTNGGKVYINSCARWAMALGWTSANGWGSATGGTYACGIMEWTRDNPEDTVAAGYPCWGFLYNAATSSSFYSPRMRSGATSNGHQLLSILGKNGNSDFALVSPWTDKYIPVNCWCGTIAGENGNTRSGYYGRIPGLVAVSQALTVSMLDEMSVKMDANKFLSNTGSATTFIAIGFASGAWRYFLPK